MTESPEPDAHTEGRPDAPATPPRTGASAARTLTQAPTAPAPVSVRERLTRAAPILAPLALFAVLVLGGITNSNIGVPTLREDPSHPHGLQFGASQQVRSDEFMTESPLWLGQIAIGPGRALNPLSVSPDFFAQLPSGPVSSVVFFEGTLLWLGPWLPDAMLFAFKWWLPTLMLLVGMPVWFRQVTGTWRWGYLGAFLALVAPASMWWSGRPINTLGFMFAACALGIHGADLLARRRWLLSGLTMVAAGILMARFPTYYQPLAIVLGIPVVLSTTGFLLARARPWWERIVSVAALGLSGALFTGLLILEDLPAIRTGLSTVFPGDRRSTGMTIIVGRVFGATDLGFLERLQSQMNGTNASEVSSAFTVLLVVVALLVVARPWAGPRPLAFAFWPMAVCAAFWLSWCTVSWGGLGYRIPLANLVPFFRAANGVGFLATIAFCLFMTQWERPRRVMVPVIAGTVTAFLSAWAGSSLQQDVMPLLTTTMVWVSSLAAGLVVGLLVWLPHRPGVLVTAAGAAALLTFSVSPVLVGLADLRGTTASQLFLDRAPASRSAGALWASNSTFVDALMLATGTPSLSARQQIGPDRAEWLKLDPGGAHEQVWNRGGSYITFDWVPAADVTFSNPNPDVILVTASPCTVASRIPALRYVVSTKPLADGCLTQVTTFRWSGTEQTVYSVHTPAGSA